MDDEKLNINEFVEFGYLQEVNRLFFHPLGLALFVIIDDNGNSELGGIYDCREELGGIRFVNVDPEKTVRVMEEFQKMSEQRQVALGYTIQPFD